MRRSLASLLLASTALLALPASAETELSVVLPVLPRQVDAPGEGFFPRLLPHEFAVRTDGPRLVALVVGHPLEAAPRENPQIDPATAQVFWVSRSEPIETSAGDLVHRTQASWRVPRDLTGSEPILVEAVSWPLGGGQPERSGALELRPVDAVWVDPGGEASTWSLRSRPGLHFWQGPLGGLPRSSQVELVLSVGLDRPAPGLHALALQPETDRLRWAGEPVAPRPTFPTPDSGGATLLEFDLSVPTNARGEARVLLFQASTGEAPRVRAILAERP